MGFRANLSKLLFDDVIVSSSPPGQGPRGRKIFAPIFLDSVVHNQPKKAIKSISTSKLHGMTQYNTLLEFSSLRLIHLQIPVSALVPLPSTVYAGLSFTLSTVPSSAPVGFSPGLLHWSTFIPKLLFPCTAAVPKLFFSETL